MTNNQSLSISQINEKHDLPEYIEGECGKIEYDFIEPKAVFTETAASEKNLYSKEIIAVVCHPHPVHGGTKDNKVVHTLCRAWRDIGIPCIRFNFRGVGQSDGEFDQGLGEYRDLCSVLAFIKGRYGHDVSILLAGFSFGAYIAARYVSREDLNDNYACVERVRSLVLIAPPIQYEDFPSSQTFNLATLLVQGDEDEVVNARSVKDWAQLNVSKHITYENLSGASHFFHGLLSELKDIVQNFTKSLLN